MPWLAAAAIAAPIISGAMGQEASKGSAKLQEEYAKKAMAALEGVQLPDIEKQKLVYQMMQNAGNLNPTLEQGDALMGNSAMEGVQQQVDPRLKQAQMQALMDVAGVAKTGMTPADMAAFEQVRRQAASEDQAKQGQILQDMQARGEGGSGAELLAKLKSTQTSADRMQQAQLEQAKAAQAARMQALQTQANMANQISGQQFGQASDIAKARDIVNQFNTQYKQGVGQRNVASQNQAQQYNLQNQQNIMNQNTALQNQQQQYNKGLLQQDFNNQMARATGQANANNQASQFYGNQAAQTQGMYSGIGQGVSQGITSYGTNQNNMDIAKMKYGQK